MQFFIYLLLLLALPYGCGTTKEDSIESFVSTYTLDQGGSTVATTISYSRTSGNTTIATTTIPISATNSTQDSNSFSCPVSQQQSVNALLDSLDFARLATSYTPDPAPDAMAMTFEFFTKDSNKTVLIKTELMASLPAALNSLYQKCLRKDFQ